MGDVQGGQFCYQIMATDILDGERVLAFDLETTGISTSTDRVVQIALIGADEEGLQSVMSASLIEAPDTFCDK